MSKYAGTGLDANNEKISYCSKQTLKGKKYFFLMDGLVNSSNKKQVDLI